MGSLDCLTTVVGSLFFGAEELNPIVAELVSSNLPAFVAIKLAVTVCVGAVFVFAERNLLANADRNIFAFKIAHNTLRASYIGIILFLVFVVVNNVVVIANA